MEPQEGLVKYQSTYGTGEQKKLKEAELAERETQAAAVKVAPGLSNHAKYISDIVWQRLTSMWSEARGMVEVLMDGSQEETAVRVLRKEADAVAPRVAGLV